MTTTPSTATKTHILLGLYREESLVGVQVLYPPRAYKPLCKELAFRSLAKRPELAGQPWELTLRLLEGDSSTILCSATPIPSPGNGIPEPLATVEVPLVKFQWLGVQMASRLNIEAKDCILQVSLLDADHDLVRELTDAFGNGSESL